MAQCWAVPQKCWVEAKGGLSCQEACDSVQLLRMLLLKEELEMIAPVSQYQHLAAHGELQVPIVKSLEGEAMQGIPNS